MANWQVISLDTTTPQLRAPGTGDGYSFNSGSTQLGVWTTTGLGIGVTPDSAFHVNSGSGATRAQLRVGYTGSSLNYYDANSHYFRDGSGASDRLTIISSGNVGIGTASPTQKLDVNGTSRLRGLLTLDSGVETFINAYYSTAYKYLANGYALRTYMAGDGSYVFANAPSGLADGSISWSERFRVTDAGNFGIGTTSPAVRLDVASSSSYDQLLLTGTKTTSDQRVGVLGQHYTTTEPKVQMLSLLSNVSANRIFIGGASALLNAATSIEFYTGATNTTLGGTQRVVIDASGNVGIGTASPGAKLDVNGSINIASTQNLQWGSSALAIAGASNILSFYTNSAERARIDSSGRLLVGGTTQIVGSANGSIEVQNTAANQLSLARFATSGEAAFFFNRSRGATVGTNTIVNDGDSLGSIYFRGANGTGYDAAAYILAAVDGTPGASADMPGRLTFWTSADGSASPTERMRISNAGNVVVNTAAVATTATDGFLYIPTCAGAPTGVPTTFTGRSPLVVDSTNNRFYVYVNGAWKYATLT